MDLRKLLGVGLVACSVTHGGIADARPPFRPLLGPPMGGLNPCGGPLHRPCAAPAPIPACGACAQPVIQPVFQTQLRPVAEMTWQPQQVVTCQSVPQVQIQRQAVVENVPVTSYQQVTVDEGSYQTVWVPRPVNRTIAQTVLQPQIRYQDVAVQVQQPVAQVQTQLVPQQIVRFVPETRQVGTRIVGWQPGLPIVAAPMSAFILPGEPIPDGSVPVQRSASGSDYMPGSVPGAAPQPDGWQTIQQRQSAAPQGTPPQASGAPSAVRVWQSQLQPETITR